MSQMTCGKSKNRIKKSKLLVRQGKHIAPIWIIAVILVGDLMGTNNVIVWIKTPSRTFAHNG
jgi:hypothetical protein